MNAVHAAHQDQIRTAEAEAGAHRAKPPVDRELEEVDGVDHPVAVEVARGTRARSSLGEQLEQAYQLSTWAGTLI